MKGIILAGGSGTRLYPITMAISKQLMPIYDKPMIYYPLSVLILAGIREIAIISTIHDLPNFKKLLGDGSQLGCRFEYIVQPSPDGLAQAFILGEEFIGKDSVALILGDNIFFSAGLEEVLLNWTHPDGGVVFAYHVSDPERYGVVEFDEHWKVLSLEEKPKIPKSNYAIPGIYFYDNEVIEIAKNLQPSDRWELEITDVNKVYLERWRLSVQVLPRGTAWFDTWTFASLSQAISFVEAYQERTGLKIWCIEEIAYRKGFIDKSQMEKIASWLMKSGYGTYLKTITLL